METTPLWGSLFETTPGRLAYGNAEFVESSTWDLSSDMVFRGVQRNRIFLGDHFVNAHVDTEPVCC